jgi:peptidoglycan/xylan/chitin deacetylase (PgdA/CDA1 family)
MTELFRKIHWSANMAVRSSINLLFNLVDPPVIVLLYHRVTTLQSDPEMLAVTPDNFRDQMQHVKASFPVVRFEGNWANTTKPTVAITFDDGYADNLLEALPILEELGIPATFFVSTGTIGTTQEFWWDELTHIILEMENLPRSFTLSDPGVGGTWLTGTTSERQGFYREIVQLMTDADVEHRCEWLAQLRLWAEPGKKIHEAHRAMTLNELRLLATSSLVTIGSHTVTHSQLASLSSSAQNEELETSKHQLEAWIGREVTTFSYPFGKRCHYTNESIALCRDAGFSKAASNFPGQAHRWTDQFQIPRHLVRNWPVDVFAQKLTRFWRS